MQEAEPSVEQSDGTTRQQVMSAQAQATPLQTMDTARPTVNGILPTAGGAVDVFPTSGSGATSGLQGSVESHAAAPSALDVGGANDGQPVNPETVSGQDQGGRSTAHTSLDPGREPARAMGASATTTRSAEFLTPRSVATVHGNGSWIGQLEWPRWMTRLGSLVGQSAAADLFPSPLPSSPSIPGGQMFTLRSPTRQRPQRAPPTPPSSSSIPAEAIQQEVQRQLGGLLIRLDEVESRNGQLLRELEQARAEAQELRSSATTQRTQAPATRLLSQLLEAPTGPGTLGDPTTDLQNHGLSQGAGEYIQEATVLPQGHPVSQGHGESLRGIPVLPKGPPVSQGHGGSLQGIPVLPHGPTDSVSQRGLLWGLPQLPHGPVPDDQVPPADAPGSVPSRSRSHERGRPSENVRDILQSGAQRSEQAIPEPEPQGLLRGLLGGSRARSIPHRRLNKLHQLPNHLSWRQSREG